MQLLISTLFFVSITQKNDRENAQQDFSNNQEKTNSIEGMIN